MADRLADELLREILAPPLRVSDSMFCNIDHVSPFSKVDHSASDVLLVCKRWMRVGTPALYHTVVIRSTAQAFAFNAAVTRNVEFGRYIKKFRLEHSYPRYITKDIVAAMPNIEALCIPTSVLGTDRPNDVYALLDQVRPQHLVIVNYRRHQSNVTSRKLLAKICETISQWNGLDRLTCSPTSLMTLPVSLSTILTPEVAIRNVVLKHEHFDPYITSNTRIILDQPKLQTLTLWSSQPRPSWFDAKSFENDARALRHLHFVWSDEKISLRDFLAKAAMAETAAAEGLSCSALRAFWRPMEGFSREQRVFIWRHIVSYAIQRSDELSIHGGHWFTHCRHLWFSLDNFDLDAAKKLIFVSSELRDATYHALCRHISPYDNVAVERLCMLMDRDPVMLGLTKTLTIQSIERSFSSMGLCSDGASAAEIFSRIRHVEQLQVIGAPGTPTSWLSQVGTAVGHSLRSLRISRRYGSPTPAAALDAFSIFDGLTALETFWWSTEDIRFKPMTTASMSRPTRGLCRLKTIELNKFHHSVTDALASWPSLPCLAQLDIQLGARKAQGFIKRHGASITHLTVPPGLTQDDFNSLKAVRVLTLTQDQPADFFRTFKCPSVQEMILKWPNEGLKWRDRYSMTAHHLQINGAKHFPVLRSITVGGWGGERLWPVDERTEKKNPWIPLAASFSTADIILKDKQGRGWRPRLTLNSS